MRVSWRDAYDREMLTMLRSHRRVLHGLLSQVVFTLRPPPPGVWRIRGLIAADYRGPQVGSGWQVVECVEETVCVHELQEI